jgi:ribosome-associated protein
MEALEIHANWSIPAKDLSVRSVRSSGPGGQNVNKVATKVELRLLLLRTEALTQGQKERLKSRFPSLLTKEGELVLTSDETRSQAMNLELVRKRLREMILLVRLPPKPRRATLPSRGSKERRLKAKKQRSDVKKQRRGSFDG